MYRTLLTALVAVLALNTGSLAQNMPTAEDGELPTPVARASNAYLTCLTDAYFASARNIPDKEKIASAALASCKNERSATVAAQSRQPGNSQAQAQAAINDFDKNQITDLSRKYDEKATRYLTLLGQIRTAYINCPTVDKDFGKGLYAFVADELIYDFAHYENGAIRQEAIDRTLASMAGDVSKSGAEMWCRETQAKLSNDELTKGFLFLR